MQHRANFEEDIGKILTPKLRKLVPLKGLKPAELQSVRSAKIFSIFYLKLVEKNLSRKVGDKTMFREHFTVNLCFLLNLFPHFSRIIFSRGVGGLLLDDYTGCIL